MQAGTPAFQPPEQLKGEECRVTYMKFLVGLPCAPPYHYTPGGRWIVPPKGNTEYHRFVFSPTG